MTDQVTGPPLAVSVTVVPSPLRVSAVPGWSGPEPPEETDTVPCGTGACVATAEAEGVGRGVARPVAGGRVRAGVVAVADGVGFPARPPAPPVPWPEAPGGCCVASAGRPVPLDSANAVVATAMAATTAAVTATRARGKERSPAIAPGWRCGPGNPSRLNGPARPTTAARCATEAGSWPAASDRVCSLSPSGAPGASRKLSIAAAAIAASA